MASPPNRTVDTSIKCDVAGSDEVYYLTPVKAEDAEATNEIVTMESVNMWFRTFQQSCSPMEPQHFTVPDVIVKAIRPSSPSGPFIGAIMLQFRDTENTVELQYYLHPDHQGKRIIVPAAKAALEWAKKEVGVERVWGSVIYDNVKAGKVMEKVANETAVGGEKAVTRGNSEEIWCGAKADGVVGEVVGDGVDKVVLRGCWTWAWKI